MSSPYTCIERLRRSPLALLSRAIIIASLAVTAGNAQTFDSLVMPGKVIEGHAKLEMECKVLREALK